VKGKVNMNELEYKKEFIILLLLSFCNIIQNKIPVYVNIWNIFSSSELEFNYLI